MVSKIINSKLTALVIGAWITYCIGVGTLSGAIFLAMVYLFMLVESNHSEREEDY